MSVGTVGKLSSEGHREERDKCKKWTHESVEAALDLMRGGTRKRLVLKRE